nr:hypothetical protein [uncultured Flavobacterium sp.]
MIQIIKGAAPASLVVAGTALHNAMKVDYLIHTRDYRKGSRTFSFTDAYKSEDVKKELKDIQHNKCCFCEAKFVNDFFHVEHFRPKGRVDKWPRGAFSYPGYYWLAYEWTNLFLAKGKTNTSYKRNFFPLSGNITRNRSHLENKVESSVLIDPGTEDPRLHIRFVNEEISGVTKRGLKNIKLLDLRNPEIDEARRTKYVILNALKSSIDLLVDEGVNITTPAVQDMIQPLRDAIKPQAEFSSMAIDLLLGWPHL